MTIQSLDRAKFGRWSEDTALHYLRAQGLKLRTRNFLCKMGEIDLIMQDQSTCVFVEVRARRNTRFCSPAESITFSKQRRIAKTAQLYLLKTGQQDQDCRFDVIGFTICQNSDTQIDWIQGAFTVQSDY